MVAYTHYNTDPRCRREASLAAEHGWDVHFYALSSDGQPHTIRTEGITLHQLPMTRYRGGSSASYILSYLRFLFLAAWAVQREHMRHRFRIVHVNTMPDFMVLTALLPKIFGARVILDIHDVMPEIYQTKFGLDATHWKIRLIKFVERCSARLADKVLTAEHPKGLLLAEHGIPQEKIEVLLNLPDDALFTPCFILPDDDLRDGSAPPVRPFRLIYHGTLAPRLGIDIALKALVCASRPYPGMKMQIFGDGDQIDELHRIAQTEELKPRVWFSNAFFPIEEIIPHIKQAQLAVLPTRHEISTDYMLPTKLLEYLAFGIPVVFTPTKTVRHYFGDDHPLYIHDPTPEETARKIIWVRENYAEAKRLTAELQDIWFSRFHWPEHQRIYIGMLERLSERPYSNSEYPSAKLDS